MATEYLIKFGPNAKATDVSTHSQTILKKIMETAEIFEVTVSSTARDTYDQARVMYDNLVGTGAGQGVEAQKALYAKAGDDVIDVFSEALAAKKDRNETIGLMKAKIIELGPEKVSRHATEVSKLNVFDVAPSSVPELNKTKWEDAIKASTDVKYYIFPPTDPGYHFEIEQPAGA